MLTGVNEVRLLGLMSRVHPVEGAGAHAYAAQLRTDNGRYGSHSITIPPDAAADPITHAQLERAAACGDELWAFVAGCLRSAADRHKETPAPATVLVRRIRLLRVENYELRASSAS